MVLPKSGDAFSHSTPIAPRAIAGIGQFGKNVTLDPRVGATRVALRRDQVKLLPRFRHHTEGEEVDRSAVLNEFAIVEESHGLVPRLFKEETSSEVSCAYLASIISELGLFNGGERAVA